MIRIGLAVLTALGGTSTVASEPRKAGRSTCAGSTSPGHRRADVGSQSSCVIESNLRSHRGQFQPEWCRPPFCCREDVWCFVRRAPSLVCHRSLRPCTPRREFLSRSRRPSSRRLRVWNHVARVSVPGVAQALIPTGMRLRLPMWWLESNVCWPVPSPSLMPEARQRRQLRGCPLRW